ncbi:MAG: hypothetical protein EAZ47_09110 [Bacteroidetes bacterium]|nr:MAG: hypothetical protein EAZ47_09110 [Bacteroidota bacterium]
MTKNGYLYVYVSNETPNINVFFDNLQVTHIAGPLVEETHYYPFGLTMAGISSRAASSLENRKKFNDGTELASKEFSDGSGLELYETNYRSLDPQIGRFLQVDPLADISVESSPFSYAYNNPILLNDPLGLIADSTDKKGNVWHGLPDVLVTSSKKPSNKTFNQIADFGFSLGWNSRIRINNYVNILANARREYEAGTMLLEDASWLRYTSLVKSREQLTLSGKFLSQLFKSNPKAYQDYLRYLQNLKDKNFARQLSVFTPNQNWTKVARLGKILGPGIQIGAELFEYTTIISQQKTIDQVEDDYDSWFNPVMKLWRPIENYLKTLGPKK